MRRVASIGAAPLTGAVPEHDAELVYVPDEQTWTAGAGVKRRQTPDTTVSSATAQVSLAALLRDAPSDSLDEARRRVAKLNRADLIARYRMAYAGGKLLASYLLADELIERGIPPCFWHDSLALDGATLAQRRILVLGDLAWLRHQYRDHHKAVRYEHGKAMLTGSEATFVREAGYIFFDGRRPVWRIVAGLSMSADQQWESAYLRSVPIKKRAAATEAKSERVLEALRNNLSRTRRVSFGLAEALASADRQHALWVCSRMTSESTPTEIARRYAQKTGVLIPRWTVAKQLAKVRMALRAQGITS